MDGAAQVKKYGLDDHPGEDGDDPAKSGYRSVNGLVDPRARTFTALTSESPCFLEKYRSEREAAWSPERRGVRDGVVANSVGGNHTDNNVDLQLVAFGPDGVRVTNLKPAADRAWCSSQRDDRVDPPTFARPPPGLEQTGRVQARRGQHRCLNRACLLTS